MKPSYADELGLLAASYAWAAREDISPLTELLDIVVSGTALYIGSGGALQFPPWPRLFMLRRPGGLRLMRHP